MEIDGSVKGWVRAADAARMLGLSRERVRQLIESEALESRREEKRQVWVKVADIEARRGVDKQGS
tara:strand:+ start:764 stop:958 length:195 start_codon:yes stop_codon:yes gene_type:complete